MIGKTLALVHRALRDDARNAWPHVVRGGLAAFVLVLVTIFHRQVLLGIAPGLRLFMAISYLNYWCITLGGASYFATAITEEKEERTLGLLCIAGLSPISILAGKWAPRMISVGLVVAIQIPFTYLCVTLGGLTWDQVLAVYLALFAHLAFVAGLGLLASVALETSGGAVAVTIAIALGVVSLPSQISWWSPRLLSNPGANNSLFALLIKQLAGMSVMNRIADVLDVRYSGNLIGSQFISNLIVAGVCCGTSWLLFNRCTENEGEAVGESGLWKGLKRLHLRPVARLAWRRAIVGKDFRQFGGGVGGLVAHIVTYILVINLVIRSSNTWYGNPGSLIAGVAFVGMILETGITVSRLYREETMRNTWATLCLLPCPTPEIIYAKLTGGLLSLIPAAGILSLGIWMHPIMVIDFLGEMANLDARVALMIFIVFQCVLAMHFAAWISVSSKLGAWPVALALSVLVPVLPVVVITNLMQPSTAVAIFLHFLSFFSLGVTVAAHLNLRKKLELLGGA